MLTAYQQIIGGGCACGRGGLIVYRTSIPAAEMTSSALLDVAHPVHDAATVCTCQKLDPVHLFLSQSSHCRLNCPSSWPSHCVATSCGKLAVVAMERQRFLAGRRLVVGENGVHYFHNTLAWD